MNLLGQVQVEPSIALPIFLSYAISLSLCWMKMGQMKCLRRAIIVVETTLNSDTNIAPMEAPIPSNAFLFFDAFLKVTTKNTLE